VRNERLTEALPRLTAAGKVAQREDRWVPVPEPPPLDRQRNGNGIG